MLPSKGYFSAIPCIFYLAGDCERPHCHYRHCVRDKTNNDGEGAEPDTSVAVEEQEWLVPNLSLSYVTQLVEKAVDKVFIDDPTRARTFNRDHLIKTALEKLKNDSVVKKIGMSKKGPGSAVGFPSYKPTPISELNKRHIPVACAPERPQAVIRKDRTSDDKSSNVSSTPLSDVLKNVNDTNQNTKFIFDTATSSSTSSHDIAKTEKIIENDNDIAVSKSITDDETLTKNFSDLAVASTSTNVLTLPNENTVMDLAVASCSTNVLTLPNENTVTDKVDGLCEGIFTDSGLDSAVNKKPEINIQEEEIGNGSFLGLVYDSESLELSLLTSNDDQNRTMTNEASCSKVKSEDIREPSKDNPPNEGFQKSPQCGIHISSKSTVPSVQASGVSKNIKKEEKSSKPNPIKEKKHLKDTGKTKRKLSLPECDVPSKKPECEFRNLKKLKNSTQIGDNSEKCKKITKKEKDSRKKENKTNGENEGKFSKNHDKTDKKNWDKHCTDSLASSKKHSSHDTASRSNCNIVGKSSHTKTSKHAVGLSLDKHRGQKSKVESMSTAREVHTKKRKLEEVPCKPIKIAGTKAVETVKQSVHPKSSVRDSSKPGRGMSETGGTWELVTSKRRSRKKKRRVSDKELSDWDDSNDEASGGNCAIVISSPESEDIRGADHKTAEEPAALILGSVLDTRWNKAKELIHRNHLAKTRIAHVPNVTSLLSAKSRLFSPLPPPPPLVQTVTAPKTPAEGELPQPKTTQRVAHGSQNSVRILPVPRYAADIKISMGIRLHYCTKLFDEMSKFMEPEAAKKKAAAEEFEIAMQCSVPRVYKNRCTLLVMKLRSSKGSCQKDVAVAEKLDSTSTPIYTHGWTLYKCFKKYLMTEVELRENGYPMPLPGQPTCGYIEKSARRYSIVQPDNPTSRKCVNCLKIYNINEDGMPVTSNDCDYHWGRLKAIPGKGQITQKFTCCQGADDAMPCESSKYHVWSGRNEDCMPGFIKTRPFPDDLDESCAGVYALDCEMCYTTRGLELARLTVVDLNEDIIFDEVIALECAVLDYCTRFSGITESKMREATYSFEDVQKWVYNKFYDKTILVGHSLENDLTVLKVFHKRVVDTSITFPHRLGFPLKSSLKHLASSLLSTIIQDSEKGHDSKEDAVTCLKLIMAKVKEDSKVRKPKTIIGFNGKKR